MRGLVCDVIIITVMTNVLSGCQCELAVISTISQNCSRLSWMNLQAGSLFISANLQRPTLSRPRRTPPMPSARSWSRSPFSLITRMDAILTCGISKSTLRSTTPQAACAGCQYSRLSMCSSLPPLDRVGMDRFSQVLIDDTYRVEHFMSWIESKLHTDTNIVLWVKYI